MKHGPRTILLKLLTILLSGSPFQWWTRQQLTAGLIPQQSQLKRSMSLARRPFRAISARTVELAGTNQFQMFATVSIKKNSCPIGYKNKDQVISANKRDGGMKVRAPGPGLKLQATSIKLQAPSVKLSNQPVQAPSDKRPSQSNKHQASSLKLQAP